MKNRELDFMAFAKGKLAEDKTTKNCVIYTRVSTKEQADNNMSLETQKRMCEMYCKTNGLNILGHFGGTYESAKTDERKAFNNMLDFVKKSKDKISQIIVSSVDRFSRSGSNAIYIKEQLKEQGVGVQSVSQPVDASTAGGNLQQNIYFMFSQYENQIRRDKCMTGVKDSLLRGEWCQHIPIGYSSKRENGKRIIYVNEQGKQIRKAFMWKANEGLTNEEIRIRLDKLGIKLPFQRISLMLKNPFYCGMLSHRALEGKVIEGKHEKLISKELFFKVNEIMSGNNNGYKVTMVNEDIPLKRFLKCDSCGRYMRGYKASKNQEYYYKCNSIGCKNNKRADELHIKFKRMLSKYTLNPEKVNEPLIKECMTYAYHYLTEQKVEETSVTEKQIIELKSKIDKAEERLFNGEITRAIFDKFSFSLKKELHELEQNSSKTKLQVSNLDSCIQKAIDISLKLNTEWHYSDYVEKQKLQFLIFPEGIKYNKEKDECRTEKVNSVFTAIADIASITENIEGKKNPEFLRDSRSVPRTRVELVIPP